MVIHSHQYLIIILAYCAFASEAITFDKYPTLNEINEYLRNISVRFKNLVAVKSVGKSHEDRDLFLVSIGASDKNAVWMDAGEVYAIFNISSSKSVLVEELILMEFS